MIEHAAESAPANRALLRVGTYIVLFVVIGTLVPVWLHHRVHGVFNVAQSALAFFLWLNVLIALWELCLFARIDLIHEQHLRFVKEYRGRELDRVIELFTAPLPLAKVLSPTTWAEIWSSYSIFDESYADRRSFGFFVDIGNGFTTLLPSVLVLYGMTYELMPARVLGVIGIVLCYQMLYGTVVYFASFVMNRRYEGHSAMNLAIFVGISNGLWLFSPIYGIVVYASLVASNDYSIFW
jgi:hypothetical protein